MNFHTSKMLPRKFKKNPAYSMIFAMIIVSAVLLVSVRAVTGTRDKVENFERTESNLRAYLAARSASDMGLLAIKDAEAGYTVDTAVSDSSYETGTTSEYVIYGKAQENSNDPSGDFYTPIPYSGSAGPSDECELDKNFDPDEDDLDPDHACNWNKLMYGESVTIPLYSYDVDTGTIKNPADLGLRSWSLKVRTPCLESFYDADCGGSSGSGGERYVMREGTTYDEDDSVILWQLIGEDSSGATLFNLVPDDETTTDRSGSINGRNLTINTEVYESLINDHSSPGDYIVLDSGDVSSDDSYATLLDACNDTGIEKLFLQLDIITPLKDENDNSIPYLEWQLVTDSNEAFADNKAIVVGQGLHEGQKYNFIYNYVVTRTTVGERASIYTVSN